MRLSIPPAFLIVSVTLASVAATNAASQAPAPTCMSLLTEGEISKALGATLTKGVQRNQGQGDTMCQWQRESALSGITMVSFRFLDATAVRAVDREALAGTGTPAPPTVAQYFDHVVKFHREMAKVSPQAIPGIGERAMMLVDPPSTHVIVQRPEGVGHLIGMNVTRNQMTALGRAVVTP